MKLDLTQTICNFKGEPLQFTQVPGGESGDMTLADALVNSLLQTIPNEKSVDTYKRFLLCKIIDGHKEVGLTHDEAVRLKDLVQKAYPNPLIVGRVWDMIEDKGTEEDK